jgi:hypothetical protein
MWIRWIQIQIRIPIRITACLAHFPTAPNEQHRALPWLITGQIQKLLDTFYPNKKGMKRQKIHRTLLSL